MAYYYATIEHIDEQVGRLIAALRRKDLYDDTLIVYTSDHGEYMGFHHLLLKGNYMYDPLVRVPLIIKFPRGVRSGIADAGLVCNTDLAPTILTQTGVEPAPGMRGRNLAENDGAHDAVFAESGRGGQLMIRTGSGKLIRNTQTGEEFLYDLEADPLEMRNLIAVERYGGLVRELRARLDGWRGTAPRPEPYLDLAARVIDQPNVPLVGNGHREAISAYFAEKMNGAVAAR
jgi:arylsulfatase A-like enzyme